MRTGITAQVAPGFLREKNENNFSQYFKDFCLFEIVSIYKFIYNIKSYIKSLYIIYKIYILDIVYKYLYTI